MAKTYAKYTVEVENPDEDSGVSHISVGEWLTWQMESRGVGNKKLWAELVSRGYSPNVNFIANVRTNASRMPMDRIGLFCDALGMGKREKRYWERELVKAYLPRNVHHLLDSPIRNKAGQMLQYLRGLHEGRQVAGAVQPAPVQ